MLNFGNGIINPRHVVSVRKNGGRITVDCVNGEVYETGSYRSSDGRDLDASVAIFDIEAEIDRVNKYSFKTIQYQAIDGSEEEIAFNLAQIRTVEDRIGTDEEFASAMKLARENVGSRNGRSLDDMTCLWIVAVHYPEGVKREFQFLGMDSSPGDYQEFKRSLGVEWP
jgi:hypothetical protein